MGNVGTEFTYMPKSDGSHYVDGIITRDGNEVGTLTGTYYSAGKGVIDASMALNRMPMSYLNGFIPDKIIGFNGYAEGTVKAQGITVDTRCQRRGSTSIPAICTASLTA